MFYTIGVSRNVRLLLAFAGLILICLSLCVLAYALAPLQIMTDRATVAPTLFVPPQSAVEALRLL